MEIANFFKVLSRRKWILILVPLFSAIITFLLVRNMPEAYRSRARISAGLIDNSDAVITQQGNAQESQINQEFGNIVQMMQLKKVVNQVSYQLMLHDLTSETPFRAASKVEANLDEAQKSRMMALLKEKYNNMADLNLMEKDEKELYELLKSKKYDHESLVKKLSVFRVGNSDFIDMQYEAENPKLTAFFLNTLGSEFVDYYATTTTENKNRAAKFLDSLLARKQGMLKGKMQGLKNYKIRNQVIDVNEQANSLIAQIADFEAKKQEAEKNIHAYSGALKNIDSKFDPEDRKYFESAVTQNNQEIMATRNRLKVTNDEYIRNNYDPRQKARIDSLQEALAMQINSINDKYAYSPLSSKQDLVTQRLNMEVNLELSKNSVASLNNEINRLSRKLQVLAPNQANIQSYEQDIDVDSREYLELTQKYNQASMEASLPVKLRQVEIAMPGTLQPSKKVMLVVLAGILSLVLCVAVLFGLYFFDRAVRDAKQLANMTQIPVIGSLVQLNRKELDLYDIWDKTNDKDEIKQFKNQLRSIRFEIDNQMGDSKVVTISSLQANEGKTFFALNLAYAYVKTNKKVLLIDGNFDDPQISATLKPDLYLEEYFQSDKDYLSILGLKNSLVVLGNKGNDTSLLELNNQAAIQTRLQLLKNEFDIILIDTSSLDTLNKSKEWMIFSDYVVPVFEVNQELSEAKKQEIGSLKKLNDKLIGWVLNKTHSTVTSISETKKQKKASKKLTV